MNTYTKILILKLIASGSLYAMDERPNYPVNMGLPIKEQNTGKYNKYQQSTGDGQDSNKQKSMNKEKSQSDQD